MSDDIRECDPLELERLRAACDELRRKLKSAEADVELYRVQASVATGSVAEVRKALEIGPNTYCPDHIRNLRAELASMTSDRDMWQELCAQMGDGWAEVREVIGVRAGETYLPAAQRLRADLAAARERLAACAALPERWTSRRDYRWGDGPSALALCANELAEAIAPAHRPASPVDPRPKCIGCDQRWVPPEGVDATETECPTCAEINESVLRPVFPDEPAPPPPAEAGGEVCNGEHASDWARSECSACNGTGDSPGRAEAGEDRGVRLPDGSSYECRAPVPEPSYHFPSEAERLGRNFAAAVSEHSVPPAETGDVCPECKGAIWIVTEYDHGFPSTKHRCPACNGTGRTERQESEAASVAARVAARVVCHGFFGKDGCGWMGRRVQLNSAECCPVCGGGHIKPFIGVEPKQESAERQEVSGARREAHEMRREGMPWTAVKHERQEAGVVCDYCNADEQPPREVPVACPDCYDEPGPTRDRLEEKLRVTEQDRDELRARLAAAHQLRLPMCVRCGLDWWPREGEDASSLPCAHCRIDEAVFELYENGQLKREEIDRGLVYCVNQVLERWQGASDEAEAAQTQLKTAEADRDEAMRALREAVAKLREWSK